MEKVRGKCASCGVAAWLSVCEGKWIVRCAECLSLSGEALQERVRRVLAERAAKGPYVYQGPYVWKEGQ